MKLILVILAALAADAQTNVLTYHNDNAHTGQYLNEILLSPSNVSPSHFGARQILTTDGPVYAQALYLSRVKIAGKQGLRNVVYVVTAHDSVYAFDADDLTAMEPLWMVNFLDPANGVTTVTQADVGCVIPEMGVIGTPVIDAGSGTIYLIAETKESGNAVFRLHVLDVYERRRNAGESGSDQSDWFRTSRAEAACQPVAHERRDLFVLVRPLRSEHVSRMGDGA